MLIYLHLLISSVFLQRAVEVKLTLGILLFLFRLEPCPSWTSVDFSFMFNDVLALLQLHIRLAHLLISPIHEFNLEGTYQFLFLFFV